MENIKEKTKKFLGRFFNTEEVKDDDDIFTLGYVNSLFAMQLVTFMEKEFKFTIENDDLEISNFRTFNLIISFIQKKTT